MSTKNKNGQARTGQVVTLGLDESDRAFGRYLDALSKKYGNGDKPKGGKPVKKSLGLRKSPRT